MPAVRRPSRDTSELTTVSPSVAERVDYSKRHLPVTRLGSRTGDSGAGDSRSGPVSGSSCCWTRLLGCVVVWLVLWGNGERFTAAQSLSNWGSLPEKQLAEPLIENRLSTSSSIPGDRWDRGSTWTETPVVVRPPQQMVEPDFAQAVEFDEAIGRADELSPGLAQILWQDQLHFYSRDQLAGWGISLGAGAILANTRMDQEFADWYQRDVRGEFGDDLSKGAKWFGEHWQMMGIYLSVSVASRLVDVDPKIQHWSDRSLRSILVGTAPLWVMQRALGGSRPSDDPPTSNWDFWADDNAVSGHTFIGAVPFLVASQLADRPRNQAAWLIASTLPGWSRIHDNNHYLSQVVIGWWLAYAATKATEQTDGGRGLEIRPQWIGRTPGLGISWNF